jgi:hypothetical protein
MNAYNTDHIVPTYEYKISTQTVISSDHSQYGQIQEIHPLYPEARLPIQSMKISDINTKQTVFEANNSIYVGSPITFGKTGTIQILEEGTESTFQFYFGFYETDNVPNDLNEISLSRRYYVDIHKFLDREKDPTKAYVGVYYMPSSSFESLRDEVNVKCIEYMRIYFNPVSLHYRVEFLFSRPTLVFTNTAFSSWLGFTQQVVQVANINTPYLLEATQKPSNIRCLNICSLPLQNIDFIIQELNRQVSGINTGGLIQMSVQTDFDVQTRQLPDYIDMEVVVDILTEMDLIVNKVDNKFVITHTLGRMFRIRTSTEIEDFLVNYTEFSTNHSIQHTLPFLTIQRRLHFFLDKRQFLCVRTGTSISTEETELTIFGGYLKLKDHTKRTLNGTLNANKNKITFDTGLNDIFGLQKQIISLVDSDGVTVILKKDLENTYIILSYDRNVEEVHTLKLYLKETAFLKGPQVLFFPDDIINRRILNVHCNLMYISSNVRYQLSNISILGNMKFSYFVKIVDFPMKTNWQIYGQDGFKDNIIAKICDGKLVATKNLEFSFPQFIHGFKFILLDEFGKALCCTSGMQIDLELTVGTKKK